MYDFPSLCCCGFLLQRGFTASVPAVMNLVELDIQENGIDDRSGCWLSFFPENFTSLEIMNFSNLRRLWVHIYLHFFNVR
ncbi:hypothetical protein SOVF_019920 [Spinacia oleracea]|nr:hypothetical protein SOVF_019920 [Spinacia oleracea]